MPFRFTNSQRYLVNANPDTNHSANPTTKYCCEYKAPVCKSFYENNYSTSPKYMTAGVVSLSSGTYSTHQTSFGILDRKTEYTTIKSSTRRNSACIGKYRRQTLSLTNSSFVGRDSVQSPSDENDKTGAEQRPDAASAA